MRKVIVIGAGLGGLATALRLVKRGYSVTIIEKNSQAGGRLNRIEKDGFVFDTGPSFFSMSYEFKEFADDCNIQLPFSFFELDPLYTVNFASGKSFALYKDSKKLAEQFIDIEPNFEEKFEKYISQGKKVFKDTVDIVIKKNFNSKLHYFITLARVNPQHIPLLFRSFWQEVTSVFTSKEAQHILSLVSFFLGGTPFDTMGIYKLLSYTEFKHDGYFNVKGGMYEIVEGLMRELQKENVKFIFNTTITTAQYSQSKLLSVIDSDNKTYDADIFVANADAAWFRGSILKRKAFSQTNMLKLKWTMGYLTMYIGINRKLEHIQHHNYYLGDDIETYSKDVLIKSDSLKQPYYYVNVLSKHNIDCAPEGCETLFFVCPVPNLITKPNWDDKDEIVNSILQNFSERIKVNILDHIVSKTIYTPIDWQSKFNMFMGSGLGPSHTLSQIGYFRPKNSDENLNNLFYVGASTVPGAGLPMAIISSKLVTERVEGFV